MEDECHCWYYIRTTVNRNFRNKYISNTDIMASIDRRIEWFTIENVDV